VVKEVGMDGQGNSATYSNLGVETAATLTTLASDSSPFRDKYEMDEDGEIIGEVSYSYSP
jgi:hypothetical protein